MFIYKMYILQTCIHFPTHIHTTSAQRKQLRLLSYQITFPCHTYGCNHEHTDTHMHARTCTHTHTHIHTHTHTHIHCISDKPRSQSRVQTAMLRLRAPMAGGRSAQVVGTCPQRHVPPLTRQQLEQVMRLDLVTDGLVNISSGEGSLCCCACT